MAIASSVVQALTVQAQLYQLVGAAALGQTGGSQIDWVITYDKNGNRIEEEELVETQGHEDNPRDTFAYDAENRLVRALVESSLAGVICPPSSIHRAGRVDRGVSKCDNPRWEAEPANASNSHH